MVPSCMRVPPEVGAATSGSRSAVARSTATTSRSAAATPIDPARNANSQAIDRHRATADGARAGEHRLVEPGALARSGELGVVRLRPRLGLADRACPTTSSCPASRTRSSSSRAPGRSGSGLTPAAGPARRARPAPRRRARRAAAAGGAAPPSSPVEAQRRAGQRDRAEAAVLDVDEQPLRAGLLPVVDAVERADLARRARRPARGRRSDVVDEPVGERRVHQRRSAPRGARRGRGSARSAGPSASSPTTGANLRHSPSLPTATCTIASLQRNEPYGEIDGWWLPCARGTSPGHRVAGALEGVDADDRGEQRGAHDRSRGRCAPARRGPRRRRTRRTSRPAGRRSGRRRGSASSGVRAGERHQPRLALGDLVVAGAPALRAVVAEAGDRQDDQARVELVQPLDGEAEAVEHARCGSSRPARRRGGRAG